MEQSKDLSNKNSVYQIMRARFVDIMNKQTNVLALSDMRDILSNRILDLAAMETQIPLNAVQEVMPILLRQIMQLGKSLSYAYQTELHAEIPNSALESLQELAPLIPEEKREKFEKIVAPEKSKEQKLITIENIKWLLSIILPMLFTLYIHYLPDKNAKESLQLQREEIAIEQEENELRRESVELFGEFFDHAEEHMDLFREFFDYIKENEIGFPEQINTLPEQFDTFENDIDPIGDLVVPDEQSDNQTEQN